MNEVVTEEMIRKTVEQFDEFNEWIIKVSIGMVCLDSGKTFKDCEELFIAMDINGSDNNQIVCLEKWLSLASSVGQVIDILKRVDHICFPASREDLNKHDKCLLKIIFNSMFKKVSSFSEARDASVQVIKYHFHKHFGEIARMCLIWNLKSTTLDDLDTLSLYYDRYHDIEFLHRCIELCNE